MRCFGDIANNPGRGTEADSGFCIDTSLPQCYDLRCKIIGGLLLHQIENWVTAPCIYTSRPIHLQYVQGRLAMHMPVLLWRQHLEQQHTRPKHACEKMCVGQRLFSTR
jgi:hypothetical protein